MSSPLLILLISFRVFVHFYYAEAITSDAILTNNHLDHFNYCIRQTQHSRLRECVGSTALNFLQRVDEYDNFTLISGFVVKKDEKVAGRALINLFDADPVDFRGILENAGAVFSERSLEWHMDNIYPGLMLKIGPTADANSVAEFVIDPAENERIFPYEEPSTARILAKKYLLPLLLGLKFNLVALVPLVFTGICLLLKKSLFLVKLIIYFSSVLGLGGAGAAIGGLGSIASLGNIIGGGFGGGLGASRPILGNWGGLPGKNTMFNEPYDTDDILPNTPYKRNGRKVKFEKPRDSAKLSTDSFYDYEKLVMQLQPRNNANNDRKILGPSAFIDENDKHYHPHFSNNDGQGWKVVNVNTKIPT